MGTPAPNRLAPGHMGSYNMTSGFKTKPFANHLKLKPLRALRMVTCIKAHDRGRPRIKVITWSYVLKHETTGYVFKNPAPTVECIWYMSWAYAKTNDRGPGLSPGPTPCQRSHKVNLNTYKLIYITRHNV
jgi:hypothetical protein